MKANLKAQVQTISKDWKMFSLLTTQLPLHVTADKRSVPSQLFLEVERNDCSN